MTIALVNEQNLVKQVVQDIQQNEITIAAKKLRQQAENSCELPHEWLLKTAEALERLEYFGGRFYQYGFYW